jgi:hypothetical protein
VAALIRSFKKYLPGCVKRVTLRGDGEFISWEAVKAAIEEGYDFIFGNKACNPPFEAARWYKARKKDAIEYNEVLYQPMGWDDACRFVAMRIPKTEDTKGGQSQLQLLEDERYKYINTGYSSPAVRATRMLLSRNMIRGRIVRT